MNRTLKIVLKTLVCVVLALLVLVAGYLSYYTLSYSRIGDKSIIPQEGTKQEKLPSTSVSSLLSWNVGFGAYSNDYSFFMDGGKYSRAFSREAVEENIDGVIQRTKSAADKYLSGNGFDFICYQEVDFDSTRSYKVNEHGLLKTAFSEYWSTYAQNYNSPYLVYPFNSPHGANKSGMATFSRHIIDSAKRVELPVEDGLKKIVDLDRCLSVNRVPVSNGKDLVLINLHLTAYSSDGSIATKQLKQLLSICAEEYNKGNYVVCAGDFNKDLLGDSTAVFGKGGGDYSWAKPFETELLEGTHMSLVVPEESGEEGTRVKTPTCRNADAPYNENQYVITVDGFLISANVKTVETGVIDTGFRYSDHNPVYLRFKF